MKSAFQRQSSDTSTSATQFDTCATVIYEMCKSIFVLAYLLHNSYKITPEFFHFVVCLTDTQGHLIWAFALWACFKVGFTARGANKACQDSVFGMIETLSALCIVG